MSTSYHVIELLKKKLSTQHLKATDADVARALHITGSAVSSYKNDREVMGLDTLTLALTLLELPKDEMADIGMALLIELKPQQRMIWEATKYMLDQAKNYGKVVVLVLSIALTVASVTLPTNSYASVTCADQSIHYANYSWYLHRVISSIARSFRVS